MPGHHLWEAVTELTPGWGWQTASQDLQESPGPDSDRPGNTRLMLGPGLSYGNRLKARMLQGWALRSCPSLELTLAFSARAELGLSLPIYLGISFIESENHLDWKGPPRSSSPTDNPALPSPPLTHVLKCYISMSFKHLWGGRHHCFPGQPVPMTDNLFRREIFPNV